jgi:choline transport protein
MIQGVIVLNYPDYIPKPLQTVLLLYEVLSFAVFVNTYLAHNLLNFEVLFLPVHVLGFFTILLPLAHLDLHGSMTDVFNTFLDGGGFNTKILSFFIGLLTYMLALIGVHAAGHMAEEIQIASTAISYAMISTVTIN